MFAELVEQYHTEKQLPTVILAEKAAQADKIAQKLEETLKASAKITHKNGSCGKVVFHFDGKVTPDNMITMTQCMQGEANAPRVIVTTVKKAVGVNFFPKCFVLLLEEPKTLTDFHQALGRCSRPAGGPMHVAFPVAPSKSFCPRALYSILLGNLMTGK